MLLQSAEQTSLLLIREASDSSARRGGSAAFGRTVFCGTQAFSAGGSLFACCGFDMHPENSASGREIRVLSDRTVRMRCSGWHGSSPDVREREKQTGQGNAAPRMSGVTFYGYASLFAEGSFFRMVMTFFP